MALSLIDQGELSENAIFKKMVRMALVGKAQDVYYAITRAPEVYIPNPSFDDQLPVDPVTNPILILSDKSTTSMDDKMLTYAWNVMSNPEAYVEAFTFAVAQDAAIKNGFNLVEDVIVDVNINSIILSILDALFPRFARVTRYEIDNNA